MQVERLTTSASTWSGFVTCTGLTGTSCSRGDRPQIVWCTHDDGLIGYIPHGKRRTNLRPSLDRSYITWWSQDGLSTVARSVINHMVVAGRTFDHRLIGHKAHDKRRTNFRPSLDRSYITWWSQTELTTIARLSY